MIRIAVAAMGVYPHGDDCPHGHRFGRIERFDGVSKGAQPL